MLKKVVSAPVEKGGMKSVDFFFVAFKVEKIVNKTLCVRIKLAHSAPK